MRWRIASLAGALALAGLPAWAQKPIVDATPVVEEFATFDGTGLAPSPTAGQLDSDEFAGTGMSDGAVSFGGTATVGDWARGGSSGGVATGGLYAWTGGPDHWLFVQPTGPDFNPGTLTIRYVNQTAQPITTLDVAYQIEVLNDAPRANSWNFSYSTDDVTYTPVPALDYTTPDVADTVPSWFPVARATTVTGLSILPGGLFYIRFSSADVSGIGTRDEIGIDKVRVTFPDFIFADGFEA
jgi:uncharacterized protein